MFFGVHSQNDLKNDSFQLMLTTPKMMMNKFLLILKESNRDDLNKSE